MRKFILDSPSTPELRTPVRPEHKPSYAMSTTSSSGLTDRARDITISDSIPPTPAQPKKELKDLFLTPVWVGVLDPAIGSIKCVSAPQVSLSSYFHDPVRPQVLTELDQLRYELEEACILVQPPQPQHLFVAVHVHGPPPNFKTIRLVSKQHGNDEIREKMAKQRDANQAAALIIQARSQAPDWVETLQIFVALDMAHFEFIPSHFLNQYRVIQTDRIWTPRSLASPDSFAVAATEGNAEHDIPLRQRTEDQRNKAKRSASSPVFILESPTKKQRKAIVSKSAAPSTIKLSSGPGASKASASQDIDMEDASTLDEEDVASVDDDVQILWTRGNLQANAFEFWIRKPARKSKAPTPKEPSIELEGWMFLDWMSTGFDDASTAEPAVDALEENETATIEEMTTQSPAFEHRSPAFWTAACAFWGGDASDHNAASGSYCAGWNKKNFLLSYQMYAASWALQKLHGGLPYVIIAPDMGFGKTAICIAIIWASVAVVRKKGNVESSDPYFNINHLVRADTDLAGQTVPIRSEVGPTLIIAEQKLFPTWAGNIRKFLGKKGLSVVLAGAQLSGKALAILEDMGCYLPETEIPPGSRWYPSKPELKKRYLDWGFEIPKPFTVRDLLERNLVPNPDFDSEEEEGEDNPRHRWQGPPPWFDGCSAWVVLTTPRLVEKNIWLEDAAWANNARVHVEKGAEQPLDSSWARAIVDEFHEQRGLTIALWTALANLPGHPQQVHVSGTPFNKPEALQGPALAAELQFYELKKPGKDEIRKGTTLVKWVHKAMKEGGLEKVQLNEWGQRQPQHIKDMLEESGWKTLIDVTNGVARAWRRINKGLVNQAKKIGGELEESDRLDVTSMDQESRVLIKKLGKILAERTIKFSTAYRWAPAQDTCGPGDGMIAAPMPYHKCFDVEVDIPTEDRRALLKKWRECLQGAVAPREENSENNKTKTKKAEGPRHVSIFDFKLAVHAFRVLLVFPCLERLLHPINELDRDRALMKEFSAGYTDVTAQKLLADPRGSALWKHMSAIDMCPNVQKIREIVCKLRHENNYTGKFPRKIIITAFLPLTVAIYKMWLMWVFDKRKEGHPAGTTFDAKFEDFDEDFVFLNSHVTIGDRIALVEKFKGDPHEEYQDRPGGMLASAASIKSGIDLVPGDNIIMGDLDWLVQDVHQVGSRVRRAEMVQLAPFTQVFRVVCFSKEIRVQWWMNQRVLSHDTIRQELINAGVDEKIAAAATTVAAKDGKGKGKVAADAESESDDEDEEDLIR
jgi:hypothetical protein